MEVMSTYLQLQDINEEIKDSISKYIKNGNYGRKRHAFHSKENISKIKYNKSLKQKLKKYKLRKDGKDDEDILDVSRTLFSSLQIKSPNKQINNILQQVACEREVLRPKNYLSKMFRKKQNIKENGVSAIICPPQNEGVEKVTDVSLHETAVIINNTNSKNEEKRHTDAFELLMNSRHNSIGTNSSGKVKSVEEPVLEEVLEKRNTKAKRNMLLQKMAEAKGSLTNMKMEQEKEECINRKMNKRAQRLKKMVTNKSNSPKGTMKDAITIESPNNIYKKQQIANGNTVMETSLNNVKSLKLINLFEDSSNESTYNERKNSISREDQEFLNKLSPSIKKKENMLCYFTKIDKELDILEEDNRTNVIKVKLNTKHQNKAKKKKNLNIKEDKQLSENTSEVQTTNIIDNIDNHKEKLLECENKKNDMEKNETKELRSRRNIKRPVKYTDDFELSSDDEILTPKKKRHRENVNDKQIDDNISVLRKTKAEKARSNIGLNKDSSKLAPIFKKQHLDPAVLEAKQKFLQSGIPDQLKKPKTQENKYVVVSKFPKVVHIQQFPTNSIYKNVEILNIPKNMDCEDIDIPSMNDFFKNLLKPNKILTAYDKISLTNFDVRKTLDYIKQSHPAFPVNRTYKRLKERNRSDFNDWNRFDKDSSKEIMNEFMDVIDENPDHLVWVDKYRAMSASQIIGNYESVKELKNWLLTWTENKMKNKNNSDSDSSDFYDMGGDSDNSAKSLHNPLILTGPTGSGKTSSVYSVASELSIKVIEVNSSSRRTGKIMLQDLHPATQSHYVNRGKGSGIPINDITPIQIKKRGRPKMIKDKAKTVTLLKTLARTESSQKSSKSGTQMSFILIDEADIVFDQDDGFCSAITQLIQCSKRPIILVTSSLECLHLQKFVQSGKILHFSPLLPRMLGTFLDVLCLADLGMCCPGIGATFLDFYKGDIRKAINSLNFYMASYLKDFKNKNKNYNDPKLVVDDESSTMSSTKSEDGEKNGIANTLGNMDIMKNNLDCFKVELTKLLLSTRSLELFNIWWSLPGLLNLKVNAIEDTNKEESVNKRNSSELTKISDMLDCVSFCDNLLINSKSDITSKPWLTFETDSVSECQSLDSYYRSVELGEEIRHTIVMSSILNTQKALGVESTSGFHYPNMDLQRKRDKTVSRHKNLTNYLNPSSVLDRRALALDYWSYSRNICRSEKSKTDKNTKRNNRFYHYLKSITVMCKTDHFSELADSLCYSEINDI